MTVPQDGFGWKCWVSSLAEGKDNESRQSQWRTLTLNAGDDFDMAHWITLIDAVGWLQCLKAGRRAKRAKDPSIC